MPPCRWRKAWSVSMPRCRAPITWRLGVARAADGTNPIAVAPAGERKLGRARHRNIGRPHSAPFARIRSPEHRCPKAGWSIAKPVSRSPMQNVLPRASLLPIGGYKGSGLALMIGLLAGVLNGAAFGRDVIDFTARGTDQCNTAVRVARCGAVPARPKSLRRDGPAPGRIALVGAATRRRYHPPSGEGAGVGKTAAKWRVARGAAYQAARRDSGKSEGQSAQRAREMTFCEDPVGAPVDGLAPPSNYPQIRSPSVRCAAVPAVVPPFAVCAAAMAPGFSAVAASSDSTGRTGLRGSWSVGRVGLQFR